MDNSVKIFSGNKIAYIEKKGATNGCIYEPISIVLDLNSCIILCDWKVGRTIIYCML